MKNILSFLQDLSANNNREWFEANKKRYENAKAEFESLLAEVIDRVAVWDKSIEGLKPKDCTYRIYRDVRFSKDKIPYKTSMGGLIAKNGRKSTGSINYLHIEPGKSFTAAGVYMPEPDALKAIRQEIDYNFKDFEAIVNDKDFKKHFGTIDQEMKLKTLPKGYTADNPAIEYLKLKSFTISKYYTDKELNDKNFANEVEKSFLLAKSLNSFLKSAHSKDKEE